MKNNQIIQASQQLSKEDQDFMSLLANINTLEDGANIAMDMDIRAHLTEALGELGKSVQLLIVLLDQHNIVNMLPEVALPQYSDIMERISEAATLGTQMVLRSQSFDSVSLFAAMPETCNVIQ